MASQFGVLVTLQDDMVIVLSEGDSNKLKSISSDLGKDDIETKVIDLQKSEYEEYKNNVEQLQNLLKNRMEG